jgi:hypothetical protein
MANGGAHRLWQQSFFGEPLSKIHTVWECGYRFIKQHHQEPSAANVAMSQRASATTSTLAALE